MSRSVADLPINWYEDLLDVPYALGGEDPETGLDCFGLLKIVYRRLGIEVDFPRFHRQHDSAPDFLARVITARWSRIQKPSLPGDVIYMRGLSGQPHVAVMISVTHALHTNEFHGVCAVRVSRAGFMRMVEGVYRLDHD